MTREARGPGPTDPAEDRAVGAVRAAPGAQPAEGPEPAQAPPAPVGRIRVLAASPARRRTLAQALAGLGGVVDEGGLRTDAGGPGPPADLIVLEAASSSDLAAAAAVRAGASRLALPLVVTGPLDDDLVARAYEVGADEVLVEPVEPEDLRRAAVVLLERSARRRLAADGPAGAARWELGAVLGRGQTATIYQARRREDGAVMALKRLAPGAPPEERARLLAEADLLRALAHVPHVVRVRDAGVDAGATYCAMDLAPGETLRAVLEARGRLEPGAAAAVVRALARAAAALAAEGVVHGDLKPSNVLVGPGGEVTVVDFGLAHRATEPAPERRGGTLTHLAPEVVRGGATTAASDVYALGVTLHEALAGAHPWASAPGADLAAARVEGLAPDLGGLLALDVPAGLVAAVEACLASAPAERPTAEELAAALLPYAAAG